VHGRANFTSRSAHRIDFLNGIAGRKSETIFGRISWTGRAASRERSRGSLRDRSGRRRGPRRRSPGTWRTPGPPSSASRRRPAPRFSAVPSRSLSTPPVGPRGPGSRTSAAAGTVDVDFTEGETGLLQHPLELLPPNQSAGPTNPAGISSQPISSRLVTFHRIPLRGWFLAVSPDSGGELPSSGKPISSRDRRNPSRRSAQGSGPGRCRRCAP